MKLEKDISARFFLRKRESRLPIAFEYTIVSKSSNIYTLFKIPLHNLVILTGGGGYFISTC